MLKWIIGSTLALVALAVLYLAFWPVEVQPVAWNPPPAPPLEGPYAPNRALASVEWVGRGVALGPESTAIDARGSVHTGTRDGRILRLRDDGQFEEVVRTGGRPLGMAFDRAGNLLVCDQRKGLLAVAPDGTIRTLATGHGGVPFRFTNDVDVGPDGTVYFTDSSSRFGDYRADILEHGGHGRLLALDPKTGRTELLLDGLQFANGVAVGRDGAYVLVAETGSYRILRYWLAGPRKGSSDVFLDDLPGFPDNITWSPSRGVFWVAIFSPRIASFDALLSHAWLRKVVYRLPEFLQPAPLRHAFALGIDEQRLVVHDLQDPSPSSFSPVTSVREHRGMLYLGSLERDALGRIRAP